MVCACLGHLGTRNPLRKTNDIWVACTPSSHFENNLKIEKNSLLCVAEPAPVVERGRTLSRISVAKGINFRGRKSNSLMNLCGKATCYLLAPPHMHTVYHIWRKFWLTGNTTGGQLWMEVDCAVEKQTLPKVAQNNIHPISKNFLKTWKNHTVDSALSFLLGPFTQLSALFGMLKQHFFLSPIISLFVIFVFYSRTMQNSACLVVFFLLICPRSVGSSSWMSTE